MLLLVYLYVLVFAAREIATEKAEKICLIEILQKYFDRESVLAVMDDEFESEFTQTKLFPHFNEEFGDDILREIMKIQKWTFQVSRNNEYFDFSPDFMLNRPRNSLLFPTENKIESTDSSFFDKLHRNPLWDSTGKNVVIVKPMKPDVDNESLTRKIVAKLWETSRSSNNLVMIIEKNETVNFYTWFPYEKFNCSKVVRIRYLDTFENAAFKFNRNLFPEKINGNLNGCELVAGSDQCIPYVFAPEESGFTDKGIEVQLLNTIAEKMNFRLNIIQVNDVMATSVNGSPAGVFELLNDQKIDLAFSCLMLNQERHLLAQALHPYVYDSLVWFVPSPTRQTHASDLFFSFRYLVWLVVLLILFLSTAVIVKMTDNDWSSTGKNLNSFYFVVTFIKLIGMSVSVPIKFRNNHFVFKIFVFLFYIYSFNIAIFFQGSLYDLFRQPRLSKMFQSVEEAVDEDLYVYLYRSTEDIYNKTNHDLWNKILRPGRFSYIEDFGQAFREIAYNKDTIALYIQFAGRYMVSSAYKDNHDMSKILWIEEEFVSYPITTYLSPGNPLFSRFQVYIHRILASGFINFWIRRIIDTEDTMPNRNLLRPSYLRNGPLAWRHLNGSFLLLSVLLSLTLLVFIFELFTYSRKISKTNHNVKARKNK